MLYVVGVLVAYVLGSVPCGLLLARMFGYGDLRRVGSRACRVCLGFFLPSIR